MHGGIYYTRLAIEQHEEEYQFTTVALVRSFSPVDEDVLRASQMTLMLCQKTDSVLAINVQDIISVVAMIPYDLPDEPLEEDEGRYFVMERPGLSVSDFGHGAGDDNDADAADGDVE